MVALLKDNITQIQEACKKHHVKTLYLIGSAAGDGENFNNNSDVDFIYSFNQTELNEMDYTDNYFDLLFNLQNILNRKVDLVPEEKIHNPYFLSSINQTKQMIYAS